VRALAHLPVVARAEHALGDMLEQGLLGLLPECLRREVCGISSQAMAFIGGRRRVAWAIPRLTTAAFWSAPRPSLTARLADLRFKSGWFDRSWSARSIRTQA